MDLVFQILIKEKHNFAALLLGLLITHVQCSTTESETAETATEVVTQEVDETTIDMTTQVRRKLGPIHVFSCFSKI